jgi:hypothetical protein
VGLVPKVSRFFNNKMTKTCENCGGERRSGRKYCSYCRNNRVRPQEMELSDEEIEFQTKQEAYEQTKAGKIGLWFTKTIQMFSQKDGVTKALYNQK